MKKFLESKDDIEIQRLLNECQTVSKQTQRRVDRLVHKLVENPPAEYYEQYVSENSSDKSSEKQSSDEDFESFVDKKENQNTYSKKELT